MAEYTEVKRGKSGAEAEPEEMDVRELTGLTLHFKHHKSEEIELSGDEGEEIMEYLREWSQADEEKD
jgi:hypothetical protein